MVTMPLVTLMPFSSTTLLVPSIFRPSSRVINCARACASFAREALIFPRSVSLNLARTTVFKSRPRISWLSSPFTFRPLLRQ